MGEVPEREAEAAPRDDDGAMEPARRSRRERNASGADQGVWVTLAEASEAAGVSVSALRKWYRNGIIESRTVPGPRGEQRLVPLDAVQERAARFAHGPLAQLPPVAGRTPKPAKVDKRPRGSSGGDVDSLLQTVLDRMADAERRATRAELALDAARREIAALRVRIAQREGKASERPR